MKPNPLPIRMAAVDPPSPLTDNGIKLLAKFADTFATVTEMTPGASCLHEFARSAEFAFGEDNWKRTLEHAPKFRAAESEEDGTTGSEDKVVMDPGIATMSLRNSVDRLVKLGQCTTAEAAQQAQRLSAGDAKGVRVFVQSRSALPAGSMTGGMTDAQWEAAADFTLGKQRAEVPQRMGLGDHPRDEADDVADYVFRTGRYSDEA